MENRLQNLIISAQLTPKEKEVTGYLKRYRKLVTSADKGAILADE